MQPSLKSLKDIKTEVKSYGYSVQEWAEKAGINWKSLYRKISNPKAVTLGEYDRLVHAAEECRKAKKKRRAKA